MNISDKIETLIIEYHILMLIFTLIYDFSKFLFCKTKFVHASKFEIFFCFKKLFNLLKLLLHLRNFFEIILVFNNKPCKKTDLACISIFFLFNKLIILLSKNLLSNKFTGT